MKQDRRRRALEQFGRLGLTGLLLLVCIVQSEYLLAPAWFEPVGRVVYRIAYMLVLPLRVVVLPVLGQENHHWPLQHTIAVCLGTPFFLWGLWRLGLWLRPRGWARAPKPKGGGGMSRREFLAASGAGAAGVAAGGYALLVEPEQLQTRRYVVPIRDLPHALDGLCLVHISDTHYGPFTPLAYIERAIASANTPRADIVVLTGDYVHRSTKSVGPGIGVLANLRSRFGTVAVLGNHEHWEGAEASRAAFRRIGVPLLDNTRLYVTPDGLSDRAAPGQGLCLAGVGDLWEDVVSFDGALGGVPERVPRVLLSHNPDVAELLGPEHRVDLMLSGHTHGGQVRVPGIGVLRHTSEFGEKYLGGLCSGPYCPVIVSRGIGSAGVPVRFCVPPELVAITLERA